MIALNGDYKIIYDKIKEMEEHFIDCKTPTDCVNYVNSYRALVILYEICCNVDPQNKKISKDRFLNNSYLSSYNYLNTKTINHLIKNKDVHSKLVNNFLADVIKIFNSYLEDEYYPKITNNRRKYISSAEEFEILNGYFKTDGKRLKRIFEIYQKEQYLFRLPEDFSEYYKTSGLTTYSPYDSSYYVFLADNDSKIKDMSILVHELGHVLDFQTYRKSHSSRNIGIYQASSIYTEVNSTYYQYNFYDYLIRNNIYKNEVMFDLIDTTASYINNFVGMSLFEDIKDYELKKNKGIIDINEISSLSEKQKQLFKGDFLDIKESLEYSYGLILGLTMLDDPTLYDKFQSIRSPYFSKEKLDSIGLCDASIGKTMVKKMNDYFS